MNKNKKQARLKESEILLEYVNNGAIAKYRSRIGEKGDSWRDISWVRLYRILHEEIGELDVAIQGEFGTHQIVDECLDVINMAKMLCARIKEESVR